GVIVIAATNRSDVLDPALVRPGRFDRQIQVPLPDVEGRLEILKVHAKKVRLGPDVDLERLAKLTPMFSGADLSAIINEAAIAATLANKDFIEQEDLEESRDKVRFGRSNRSRRIEEKERVATAYHEAGHAVLQALLPDTDPLHKVTIIPRGQALGATMSMPDKDRYGYSKKWILATMRMTCGGRIAEERQTQDVSSGAAMDISQVTRLARAMIEQWGMSDRLGFVHYGEDDNERFVSDKPFSDDTAKIIDEEVRRIVDEAYRDAERMLDENWQKVIDVSEALLQHETLTADEVHQLMRGEQLRKSGTSALLANERRRNAPGTTAQPDGQPDDGETDAGGTVPTPA
ncbi:MAG: AAA family ATPase, partial [Planctomycetota bacterium]